MSSNILSGRLILPSPGVIFGVAAFLGSDNLARRDQFLIVAAIVASFSRKIKFALSLPTAFFGPCPVERTSFVAHESVSWRGFRVWREDKSFSWRKKTREEQDGERGELHRWSRKEGWAWGWGMWIEVRCSRWWTLSDNCVGSWFTAYTRFVRMLLWVDRCDSWCLHYAPPLELSVGMCLFILMDWVTHSNLTISEGT